MSAEPAQWRLRAALIATLWVAVLAAATLLMLAFRDRLENAHIALVYLLVVLGGSAAAGRWLGISLSVLAFLGFNYFFLLPYRTLSIENPFDWLVLVAFLVTGLVAAHLLSLAQQRAVSSRRHLDEARRLAVLIATVSHDLRTPLATISALAQRLAVTGEEDALSIAEEAARLDGLVADLLELSRLSAGAPPLRIELNAVDDLVGSALDRARGALGSRELRVHRTDAGHLEEPILFGRFDLVQSLRVLVNLLENAAKYSPAAAPIDLFVGRRNGRLLLTVADRGPGVASGDASRIFEAFYRPPGAAADVGGAGLGLAIARRLAEAQGGSLTYRPREGGGSEFQLELEGASARELASVHEIFTAEGG